MYQSSVVSPNWQAAFGLTLNWNCEGQKVRCALYFLTINIFLQTCVCKTSTLSRQGRVRLGLWESVLHLLVPFQVAGVREVTVADGASKGPLARMHVAVDVQLALAHKALATELAGVRLLPGMPGQVLLQVRLQEEALGTAGAAVRPFHGDSLIEGHVEVVVGWGQSCGSGRRLAGGDGACGPTMARSSWSVRRRLSGLGWLQSRTLTHAIVCLFVQAHPSVDDNHVQKRGFEHVPASWTIQGRRRGCGSSDITSCLHHLGGEVESLVFISCTVTD